MLNLIYDILPVNNYLGNNSSTQFDFDFYVENENQLKVFIFDEHEIKTELKNNIDYRINELGNKNGSFIVFPLSSSSYSILNDKQKISLELNLSAHQITQYNNSSLLNLSAIEYSFDYLTRLVQILKRKVDLCVKVEECSNSTPNDLMNLLTVSASQAKEYANQASDFKNEVEILKESVELSNKNIVEINDDINLKYNSMISIAENKADTNLDNANPSQSFKEQSITWGIPDYTAGVSKVGDTEYIAECAGLITGWTSGRNISLHIYVNDVKVVGDGGGGTDIVSYHVEAYVDKGDKYKVTQCGNNCKFYPLKGANQ